MRDIKTMEVCGTHTMTISKYAIRELIPRNIKLISGPGCPVCVTSINAVDEIIEYTKTGAIIATFGDLIRVPGSNTNLAEERSCGKDIRVVYSPFEALEIAKQTPNRQVIFVGIGFETTTPGTALTIKSAEEKGVTNFSVLSYHKTMPQILRLLLEQGAEIDGFILPGHVCTITGIKPFMFLVEDYDKFGVVSGFEPDDIIESIKIIKDMAKPKTVIQYKNVVKPEGNILAQKIINEVFKPVDVNWRGFGVLDNSGLDIRGKWSFYDARKRWKIDAAQEISKHEDDKIKCRCKEIFRGLITPLECEFFGTVCNPETPIGPCMVSSEGACAAYYKYGG